MPPTPDFIVDPSGNVRDARGQYHAQHFQSPSHATGPGPSTPGQDRHTGSPRGTPGGIIFIPIGLIITLIIAVLRMCGGPAQSNSYPESDVRLLGSGLSSYDRGDYEKALIYFNMAIASQPDMGEAYNDRGLAYYAMGQTQNALADFNKAIELLPDPAVSYSNRGGVYLFQGNHEQAIADLDKAIELSPGLAKAYHNRGLTYLDLGNYDQAIADFDQAIGLTPEGMFSMQATMESRMPTGESLVRSGFFTSLVNGQTYADLPKVYASRAMAYLEKGDNERAAADMEKATQLGLDPVIAQIAEGQLPASTSAPHAGHWEGNANPVGEQGVVSFDIWADGRIHDFRIDLIFASGSSCTVTSHDVMVQPDGTFSLAFETPGTEGGILAQGQFENNTVVVGSLSGDIQCMTSTRERIGGGQSYGDSWSAQWISGPEGTPTGTSSFGLPRCTAIGKASQDMNATGILQ